MLSRKTGLPALCLQVHSRGGMSLSDDNDIQVQNQDATVVSAPAGLQPAVLSGVLTF